MFKLMTQEVDDEGNFFGPLIPLAVIDGGKVTGKMSTSVKEILARDDVQIGLAGRTVKVRLDKPWLIAYALTMMHGDLLKAGVPVSGWVRAFTKDGTEIPMPANYAANMVDDWISEENEMQLAVSSALQKAGRNVINNALELLDDMPDVKPGYIAVPWPVMERPKLADSQWEESIIQSVRIDELFASQDMIKRERVQFYVENPGAIEEGRRAYANVYGKLIGEDRSLVIVDGHHRLAALWLLGADMANVWYLQEGD